MEVVVSEKFFAAETENVRVDTSARKVFSQFSGALAGFRKCLNGAGRDELARCFNRQACECQSTVQILAHRGQNKICNKSCA